MGSPPSPDTQTVSDTALTTIFSPHSVILIEGSSPLIRTLPVLSFTGLPASPFRPPSFFGVPEHTVSCASQRLAQGPGAWQGPCAHAGRVPFRAGNSAQNPLILLVSLLNSCSLSKAGSDDLSSRKTPAATPRPFPATVIAALTLTLQGFQLLISLPCDNTIVTRIAVLLTSRSTWKAAC